MSQESHWITSRKSTHLKITQRSQQHWWNLHAGGKSLWGYLSAPKVYPQAIALPKLCELFWIPAWLGQWMSNVFRLDIAIAFAERCKHFFSCSGIGGLRKRPFLAHAVCWWFNSKDTQFVLVNASLAKCVNKCVENILSKDATSFSARTLIFALKTMPSERNTSIIWNYSISKYVPWMFQSNDQRILTLEWFEDGITLLAGGGDQPPAYSMSGKRPSNCTVSVKKTTAMKLHKSVQPGRLQY